MAKPAYYNEIDPYAAQWLRNLIAAGEIPAGDVDERSIEDVRPSDLTGYGQRHFFAGIGVWARALRDAGVPDDADVTTGSCPCQPFSAAGKGTGFADERHLWPAFHYLIEETRPAIVFGEQVASAHVNAWIDLVQTDLEALDFAFGACAFPAAGVGAPHIRDRTYWLAYAGCERREWGQRAAHRRNSNRENAGRLESDNGATCADETSLRLAYADDTRSQGRPRMRERADQCATRPDSLVGGLADAPGARSLPGAHAGIHRREEGAGPWNGEPERSGAVGERPGPTNGYWRTADWLACRDDKWRPVEPGTFPLANGATSRVGRLRAYGNAIVLPQATEFVRASLEAINVTFR